MLISIIRVIRDYFQRRAALAAIAELDERTLKDIGLSADMLPSRWNAMR
jgi:uncharacterized protein YjiS (DUF1127 family)